MSSHVPGVVEGLALTDGSVGRHTVTVDLFLSGYWRQYLGLLALRGLDVPVIVVNEGILRL